MYENDGTLDGSLLTSIETDGILATSASNHNIKVEGSRDSLRSSPLTDKTSPKPRRSRKTSRKTSRFTSKKTSKGDRSPMTSIQTDRTSTHKKVH